MYKISHLNPIRQIESSAGEYRGKRREDYPEDAEPCHLAAACTIGKRCCGAGALVSSLWSDGARACLAHYRRSIGEDTSPELLLVVLDVACSDDADADCRPCRRQPSILMLPFYLDVFYAIAPQLSV